MKLQTLTPRIAQRMNLERSFALLLILAVLLALVGIRPAYAAGLTLIVDTSSDANLTACTAAANDCSLRGAINAANSAGGSNTIAFDGTVFYFGGGVTLGSDLPNITSTLTIIGSSTATVSVTGNNHQLFYVNTGANLTLKNLTLENGAASYGAAIYINSLGTVTVTDSVLSGNVATNNGGAIYVVNGTLNLSNTTLYNNNAGNAGAAIYSDAGTLTLSDCAFTSNDTTNSTDFGGALYNRSGGLSVTGCTFSGNFSPTGGAIYNDGGNLKLINSTLTSNSGHTGAGLYSGNFGTTLITNSTFSLNNATINGGIYNASGTLTLNNSIFAAGNGGACYRAGGTINAQNSLISDGLGCVTNDLGGNLTGDPKLGGYGNNGGPTNTMALQDGSPAINAGSNALALDKDGNPLLYDQRGSGYDRIANGTVDMGAYEAAYTYNFVVDTTSDADLEGCSAAASDCSLRGAITLANVISGTDTITFDPTVFSIAKTITLGSTLPTVTTPMIINGPGEALLTVDGIDTFRVFYAGTGSDLTLTDMTVANGNVTGAGGGGIYVDGASLTVSNATFSSNGATGNGGAIDLLNGSSATLTSCTLSGNGSTKSGGAIALATGTSAQLTGCSLSGNTAGSAGGAIYTGGTLTITGSTFTSNTTTASGGGGIFVQGLTTSVTTTVSSSTFTGNTAQTFGGGIAVVSGNVIIGDSTFNNNNGTNGGGVEGQGANVSITIFNSTLSGNTASNLGGGIHLGSTVPSTTITNTTIAGNSAANNGGGINVGGTATMNNSIVAYNTGGVQCSVPGSLTVQYSLIEDTSCNVGTGNLSGDPLLGALANNGGTTETMALQDGSPAINAGDNTLAVDANSNPLSYDQRGSGYDRAIGGTVDMGAYELVYTPDFVVDRTDDLNVGICSSAPNDCSLRGAINLANTVAGTDTITFDSTVFNPGTITLSSTLPEITSTMTIDGAGQSVTVSGDNAYRVMLVNASGTLNLNALTIANGFGGGEEGGGILSYGSLNVSNSTFSDNSSGSDGGAISVRGHHLTVINSTLVSNSAGGAGGAIYSIGGGTISNSTLVGNSAGSGGGIFAVNTVVYIQNSIIANSSSGGDCGHSGGVINAQNSLIADNLDCVNGTNLNNLTGDPLLSALADNGGATATIALQAGSPAINAGSNALAVDADGNPLSYDQRGSGYNRIFGGTVDMGAYEATYTYDFVVDTTSDADLEGCSAAANDCSLRGAITLANAVSGTDTITFDSNVFSTAQIITLTSTLPNVTSTMIINGPGADLLTVDGNHAYQVLYEATGADLTLNNLTIANGSTSSSGGGVNNNGTLTLTNSVLSGNSAVGGTYSNTFGGGIYNTGTMTITNSVLSGNLAAYGGGIYNHGTLTVTGSTLSGNMSTDGYYGGDGGGIYNNGTLKVTGSTFTGNIASFGGGGIANFNGTTTVTNSTFTGNIVSFGSGGGIVGDGAGIFNDSGTTTVTNSTIAGNAADHDGSGVFAQGGILNLNNSLIANNTGNGNLCSFSNSPTLNAQNTLIEDNLNCVNGTNSNNLTGDPSLGVLTGNPAYYPLNAGSPAINAGDNALAVDADGNPLTTDEAGNDRIQGGTVDMGAYKSPYAPAAPTITTQPQDATIFSGQTATLTVVASGSSLSYQWYQGTSGDTSTLVGTDSDSFTTPSLTADTSYWVRVSNPGGNVDSDTATITVQGAPTITTQPQDQTIASGQTATLTVVASGSSLSYQWYQGISGDTSTPVGTNSDSFTTPALTTDTSYWVRVSNLGGNADSNTATVTVQGAPTITTQPQDTTIFSGQTADLSVVASGSSLSYQWYQGNTGDISVPAGTDSASFTTPALTADTSYWVRVSNLAGSIDSDTATVTVTSQVGEQAILLLDSQGNGLAGATAQYYLSGWHDIPGSTGSDGKLPYAGLGLSGNLTFRISYAQASIQKQQNIDNDPQVVFQTTLVSMKLFASDGTTELTGTAEYYASGWNTFGSGSTTTSMELLPTNYTFRVSYGGASVQVKQDVSSDPNVVFQTQLATMQLLAADGTTELTGTAEYYASGWKSFGNGSTTTSMELLPTNYTFRVSYGGASIQKKQDVNSNPAVVFQTTVVNMQLLASDGTTELTGTTEYYASGWKSFGNGSTTTSMELLPTNYTFRVSYGGASIQKKQDVSSDTAVVFQTMVVSMQLLASDGTTELTGTAEYYASGWNTFGSGSTTTSMELLPTNYTFRVTYGGASVQKQQDVSSDPQVVFQTVAVHSDSETATQYYASGWQTFTQDMELLPGDYPFRFSDGTPQTTFTLTAGEVNHIH